MAIACSCHGVRDGAVVEAIDAGASTVEELGRRCLAGLSCGGCHPTLEQLLADHGIPTSAGAAAGTAA